MEWRFNLRHVLVADCGQVGTLVFHFFDVLRFIPVGTQHKGPLVRGFLGRIGGNDGMGVHQIGLYVVSQERPG